MTATSYDQGTHATNASRGSGFVVASIAVVLLVAAGCGREESEPAPIKNSRLPKRGAVLGIRMGGSMDARGALVKPGVSFPADAPRIVAVVQLGELPSPGTLSVEWRRVRGPKAEAPLFTQRVPVRSFDRAYAVGVSPGTLASGWYEVSATLGEHNAKTLWRVASGSADGANVGPPAGGESGAVARPGTESAQSPSSPHVPCSKVFGPYADFWFAVIEGSAHTYDPDCDRLLVAAKINGPPELVARTEEQTLDFRFDPCDLQGGTDMPGTVVHLYGWIKGHDEEGSQEDVVLFDPNVEGPSVYFESTLEEGTTVAPGDKIPVDSKAFEMPPSPGIRSLQITSPEGTLGRIEAPFKPCDLSRHYMGWLSPIYIVPENPPPVIELRATADDYADRVHTEVLRFPTAKQAYEFKGVRLRGTIFHASTGSGTDGMSTQKSIGDLSLVINDDRTVRGTANLTYTYHGEGRKDCGRTTADIGPLKIAVPVRGWATEEELELQFVEVTYSFTYNTDTCGRRDAAVLQRQSRDILPVEVRVKRDERGFTGESHIKGDSAASWSSSVDWKIEIVPDDGRGVPVAAGRLRNAHDWPAAPEQPAQKVRTRVVSAAARLNAIMDQREHAKR